MTSLDRFHVDIDGSGPVGSSAGSDVYRILFESLDEAYCLCEMVVVGEQAVDYRFLEVNALFEAHTGLSDPIGRTATELVPGLEQHWIDTYARVALGGETLRFE